MSKASSSSQSSPYKEPQRSPSSASFSSESRPTSPPPGRRRHTGRRRIPLKTCLYSLLFAIFLLEVALYNWLAVKKNLGVVVSDSPDSISNNEQGDEKNDTKPQTQVQEEPIQGSKFIEKMYYRIQSLHETCKNMTNTKGIDGDGSGNGDGNVTGNTKSFKILEDLKQVVIHDHSRANNSEAVIESDKSSTSTTTCSSPPIQSCSTLQYSVVITYHRHASPPNSNENAHDRTLFLNILSLMTSAKSKSNIIVLVHGDASSIENMKKDHNYGRRIWNWHENKVIQLIIHEHGHKHESEGNDGHGHDHDHSHDHDDDDLFFAYHPAILEHIKNDIILFLDGSQPIVRPEDKRGGMESLNAGFELVRQDSHLLVGSQVTHWSWSSDKGEGTSKDGDDQNKTNQNGHERGDGDGDGDGGDMNAKTFIPICGNDDDNHGHVGTRSIKMESIHASGMFLHKNFLCYLWDDLFAPLRVLAQEISRRYPSEHDNHDVIAAELASMVISAMIVQLGGRIPSVYPMLRQTWDKANREEEEDPHRKLSEISIVQEELVGGHLSYTSTAGRRRRTNWNWNDEEIIEVKKTPRRRKLHEKNAKSSGQVEASAAKVSQLKPEDALSILQYFGSYSLGQNCWCKGDGEKELENLVVGCHERCETMIGRAPTVKDLPWMNEQGDGIRCK